MIPPSRFDFASRGCRSVTRGRDFLSSLPSCTW